MAAIGLGGLVVWACIFGLSSLVFTATLATFTVTYTARALTLPEPELHQIDKLSKIMGPIGEAYISCINYSAIFTGQSLCLVYSLHSLNMCPISVT